MNKVSRGLAILIFLPAFSLGAQDAEPEEPGIVLPPTLLEVEDLQVEEISAVIPEEEIQLLPEIEIPLPQAEDILLPEERFDIPYPDQLDLSLGGVARAQNRIDIFSEGEIAVGSMNHVRGDLTLYRLGPDPRFDLRFYHDKIDGYGLRSAGSGYFHSDDILDGSISFATGSVSIAAEAGIAESSEGLQGVSEYESLTYRRGYGKSGIEYSPSDILLLTGTVGAAYAQQILSSSEPSIKDELDLRAEAGLELTSRYIDFQANLGYLLLNASSPSHTVDLAASASFKVNETLAFGLSGAVVWEGLATFRFPFSASGSWQPSDAFAFEFSGGYFVDFPTYGHLRDEYIFIDLADTLGPEFGWFGTADTQIRLFNTLFLTADVDFKYFDSGYQVNPVYSQSTGLFPLEVETAALFLQTGADLSYEINRTFGLSLSWTGRLLGGHPYEPAHTIDAGFSYRNPSDIFGVGIDLSVPLEFSGTPVPVAELSTFYRITESVRLRLDVADPLAPLLPDGRLFWAPYEAPGFHMYLGTNISL